VRPTYANSDNRSSHSKGTNGLLSRSPSPPQSSTSHSTPSSPVSSRILDALNGGNAASAPSSNNRLSELSSKDPALLTIAERLELKKLRRLSVNEKLYAINALNKKMKNEKEARQNSTDEGSPGQSTNTNSNNSSPNNENTQNKHNENTNNSPNESRERSNSSDTESKKSTLLTKDKDEDSGSQKTKQKGSKFFFNKGSKRENKKDKDKEKSEGSSKKEKDKEKDKKDGSKKGESKKGDKDKEKVGGSMRFWTKKKKSSSDITGAASRAIMSSQPTPGVSVADNPNDWSPRKGSVIKFCEPEVVRKQPQQRRRQHRHNRSQSDSYRNPEIDLELRKIKRLSVANRIQEFTLKELETYEDEELYECIRKEHEQKVKEVGEVKIETKKAGEGVIGLTGGPVLMPWNTNPDEEESYSASMDSYDSQGEEYDPDDPSNQFDPNAAPQPQGITIAVPAEPTSPDPKSKKKFGRKKKVKKEKKKKGKGKKEKEKEKEEEKEKVGEHPQPPPRPPGPRTCDLLSVYDFHSVSVEEVLERVGGSLDNGLDEHTALQRMERDGPNRVYAPSDMHNFEMYSTSPVRLIRAGERMRVQSKELVVGDLVELEVGFILADLRVVKTSGLLVNTEAITGDPEPKKVGTELQNVDEYFLSGNLLFYGTDLIEGSGLAVVMATGEETALGRMSREAQNIKARKAADGPKAGEEVLKALEKKGVYIRDVMAGANLGRVNTLIVDSYGFITENKLSVCKVFVEDRLFSCAALPNGDKGLDILLRDCVLPNSSTFVVDPNKPKDMLDIDSLEVEEWDEGGGAILRFYEKNHPMRERAGNNFYCNTTRRRWKKETSDVMGSFHMSIHSYSKSDDPGGHRKYNYLLVISGNLASVLERCSHCTQGSKEIEMTDELKQSALNCGLKIEEKGEKVIAFAHNSLCKDKFERNYKFDFYPPNFPTDGCTFIGFISLAAAMYKTTPSAVIRAKEQKIKVIVTSSASREKVLTEARKAGLLVQFTKYDLARQDGVSVEELSPERIKQAQAAIVSGPELLQMNDNDLYELLDHHTEILFDSMPPNLKQRLIKVVHKNSNENVVAVTGTEVEDCQALTSADVGIALYGCSESVINASDVVISGGGIENIISSYEFVKKTLEKRQQEISKYRKSSSKESHSGSSSTNNEESEKCIIS